MNLGPHRFFYFVYRRPACTYWQCSQRNRNNVCPATVTQRGGTYSRGPANHTHPPTVGLVMSVTTKKTVRDDARRDLFQSASALVENVLSTVPRTASDNRPHMQNLVS